jgi:predicted enzyme related to lactoylglutathione lyase
VDSGSRTDGVYTLCREDELLWRLDEAVDDHFRVGDLDKMARQLEAAGIEVKVDPTTYPNVGRFARIHDPEGNPIELWQPMKAAK